MNQWEQGRRYWEQAGEVGYGEKMYASGAVEAHIRGRLWARLIEIADGLGVERGASVLDLGCGDGQFANEMLAPRYGAVLGLDFATPSIARANRESPGPHATFVLRDITTMDYATLDPVDAVFLVGILHHVKSKAAEIVKGLAQVSSRVVVLEPNGAHPIRKLLELTPSYRAAGEDSFTAGQLRQMFADAGYKVATHQRVNVMPNFTPKPVFDLFLPLEQGIESNPLLSHMCTVNLFGFRAD